MLIADAAQISYASKWDYFIDAGSWILEHRPSVLSAVFFLRDFFAAFLVLFLALSPLFNRWLRRRTERVFEPINIHRRAWAARWAEQDVSDALARTDASSPAVSDEDVHRLTEAAKAWYYRAPLTLLWDMVKLAGISVLLFHIIPIMGMLTSRAGIKCLYGTGMNSNPESCLPEGAASLAVLWDPKTDLFVRAWKAVSTSVIHPLVNPQKTATTIVAVFLLMVIIKRVHALAPSLLHFFSRERSRHAQEPGVSQAAAGGGPVREVDRRRPTVLLLTTCRKIRQAHQRLEAGGSAPEVNLKAAERVVYDAWRTRHGKTGSVRQRDGIEHAERVVGALRAMESRRKSDADTGRVLEETRAMLLKISCRYEEGLTLRLLDPEDLEGVEPAVRREWLRRILVVVAVAGLIAATKFGELSGEVLASLVVPVVLITGTLAGRGRIDSIELIDAMRGRSQRP
ncbi:hypothetical protein ACFYZN_16945 [Streptomyces sp. NPDC001777]|uniref:hypothetical protein n=1 Tax=Streptomyces sp. NPDC001777 TaxID=3364608 RepID=UPI003699D3F4